MGDVESRAELARLTTRLGELSERNDRDGLTDDESAEFERTEGRIAVLLRHRQTLAQREQLAGYRTGRPPVGMRTEAGAFDRGTDTRQHGEARALVDGLARRGMISDDAGQHATRMVESGPIRARQAAASWIRAAGSDDYLAAFAKLVADPARGHLLWTEPEAEAFRTAEAWRRDDAERAQALNPLSAGGYLAPLALDPSITLTNAGTTSALRPLAKVVTIATDRYQVHSSAGVTAEWKAEAAEVAEQTATITPDTIPVHTGDAYVTFSVEAGMDAVGLLEDLRELLADAYDRQTATAFVTGSGTGQPEGLVTGLTGTAQETTGSGEVITRAMVYGMQNALGSRWQPGARWLASLSVLNALSQLTGTTADDRLAEEIIGGRMLRRPYSELTELPANPDPAVTATNRGVLIYGDVRTAYTIVQRVGTTIELIPHVFGPNRRPTLQRGLLLWHRTGGGVVVPQAARMLTITTAA